jgi:hypothetical protein
MDNNETWEIRDMDLDLVSKTTSQNDLIKAMESNLAQIPQPNTTQPVIHTEPIVETTVQSIEPNAIEIRLAKEKEALKIAAGSTTQEPSVNGVKPSTEDVIIEEPENSNESEESNSDDAVSVIDAIKALNLIDIPQEYLDKETLTDDEVYHLAELTNQNRREDIKAKMKASITDPYEQQLFDYFSAETKDKNLLVYKEMLDDISYFDKLDINDINNQREVLTYFLRDGLDPNNAAHAYRLGLVEGEVEAIMASDRATEQTDIAKKHIQKTINTERLIEKRRVETKAKEERQALEQSMQESKAWYDDVNAHVNLQAWDNNVKQKIFDQLYKEVTVNGEVKSLWSAKLDLITDDKETHIALMSFLADYDMNTKKFSKTISQKEIKNAAVKKINGLFSKKVKKPISRKTTNNNASNEGVILVNNF